MDKYSINEFSKITGLNKILIRTWENRYSFVNPHRTSTNIRYYDDNMIIKTLRYKILVDSGFKMSVLTKLPTEQIDSLINNTLKTNNKTNKELLYISQIIESSISYNSLLFHNTYEKCVKDIGIIKCYKNVLLEALNRIGILWINQKINPAQEHFLSELIRIKISKEIEKLSYKILSKETWVLFLPENELHDIGLFFTYLILRIKGHNVIYFGQNLPISSLVSLKNKKKIDNILFFLVSNISETDILEKVEFLQNNFSESNKHIITKKDLLIGSNCQKLNIVSDFDKFINQLFSHY